MRTLSNSSAKLQNLSLSVLSLMMFAIISLASLHVNAQVSLTATGGTTSGSYTTLRGAFNAINAGTHTGTIGITITANTTETAIAALNASGSGAASYSGISIQPSGNVTVSGNLATELIKFNGSDNVTINGLNSGGNSLTISNASTSSTAGTSTIKFIGDASSNTITNSNILGSATISVSTYSNGGTIYFSTGTTTGNDNNTISNCNIGAAGVNLPSRAIWSLGSTTNTTINNSNNTITGCNIYDFFFATGASRGIDIYNGSTDWTISNNKIYQTASRTQTTGSEHTAISVLNYTTGTNFQISGNTIGFASSNGTGTYTINGTGVTSVTGMLIGTHGLGTPSVIQNNIISNISVSGPLTGTATNTAPFVGINFDGLTNVTGNTIGASTGNGSITVTTTSNNPVYVYGIISFAGNTISGNNIGSITTSSSAGSITFLGIQIFAQGSSCSVLNNTIGSTSTAGSITNNATGIDSRIVAIVNIYSIVTISGNTVANLTISSAYPNSVGSLVGISQEDPSVNGHSILQNAVYALSNTNPTAAVFVVGIRMSGQNTTGSNTISRNFVHSLSVSSTNAAANIRGIAAWSGFATTYSNNMIRLGIDAAGASITKGCVIEGIYESGGYNNFYFNSVYIGGSGTISTASTYAFRSTVTNNTRVIRDNIFYNARSRSSGTGKHYAIQVGGTGVNPAGLTINNNIYFADGTGGVLGSYGGSDKITLAAWQAAIGQDANSFFINPRYINPAGSVSTVNLHIDPVLGNDNYGAPAGGITVDYDGETRNSSTPDVGADEFTTVACNGAVGGTASTTTPTFCSSGSATITASGFSSGATSSYSWESSPTGNANDFVATGQTNPLFFNTGVISTTTYYRLMVTCGNNSSTAYSNVVTITVIPSVASISAAATTICNGQSVTLTENGGTATSWSWSPGGATTQSITVSPATTTTYTVTTMGAGGCTANASLKITVNPSPVNVTASASNTLICEGTSINLTSSANAYPNTILTENFNSGFGTWTTVNNSTGGFPANAAWTLRPDGYTYNQTFHSNDNSQFIMSNSGSQGISGTTNTELISPPFSTVGYTSVTVSFYHYFGHYTFDTAKVEASTDSTSWTTLLTLTNSEGGYSSFSIRNVSLTAPFLNQPKVYVRFHYLAGYDFYWAIDNITIKGNTTNFTYAWTSSPAGFTSNQKNPTGVTPTVNTVYTVTLTNSYNCSASASTNEVTVNPAATVSAGADIALCNNEATVNLNGSIGGSASSATWTTSGDGSFDDANSLSAVYTLGTNDISNGTVTLTLTTDDPPGLCGTASDNVVINIGPQLFVGVNAGTITCGGGTTTVTVTASGGTPPYAGDGTFNASAGTHIYTVTDAIGCSASDTITITEPPQLFANAVAGSILCNGGTTSVTVSATGGTPPYTGEGTFNNLSAGTYIYTVTDANGCSSSDTITITEPSQLNMNAVAGTIQCVNGTTTVTVTATGGTPSYTGTGTFNNVSAGTYTYTVTDANGCSVSQTITIQNGTGTAPATPGLITGPQYNLCGGGTFTYTIAPVATATSYIWTVPAGFTLVQNNGTSAQIQVPSSFTTSAQIKVAASNFCGTSAQSSLTVYAVAPNPSTGIVGPTSVASGQQGVVYKLPNGPGVTYTWIVPTGATIVSGQGTFKITVNFGSSSGYVKVTVSNACGTAPQGKIYVTVGGSSKVTNDVIAKSYLRAYPNPTQSIANVLFNADKTGRKYEIVVTDVYGKAILRKSGLTNVGDNMLQLDMSRYANTMYVVKLVMDDEVRTVKLYKEK